MAGRAVLSVRAGGPIPGSYWVEDGRLLAGEYPGATLDADTRPRLSALGRAGVTSFVDLTEEGEGLTPYRGLLAAGVRHVRLAIRDFGCPSEADMARILDTVDSELALGHVVYLHCRGGRGRTGTVVGCWLARHGRTGDEALVRIARLRSGIPDATTSSSPETHEQGALVRGWMGGA